MCFFYFSTATKPEPTTQTEQGKQQTTNRDSDEWEDFNDDDDDDYKVLFILGTRLFNLKLPYYRKLSCKKTSKK